MIYGHGGGSEKEDKRIYNRALRSRARQRLRTCDDFDAAVLPEVRDVSNPWSMAKDGKSYCTWLASWRATLAKVTRVRDGRSRYLLVVTNATYDRAEAEERRLRARYASYGWSDETIERIVERRDINRSLDLIRK
jgi:hypothetical protein